MKLRLQRNSVRLRLSPVEITELNKNGIISETIIFNQFQTLIYTLKISDKTKVISVDFTDRELVIEIPFDTALNWTETNLTSLEYEQIIDQKSTLKITIEKDFAQ